MTMVKVYKFIGEYGDGLLFVPIDVTFVPDENFKFICEMPVPKVLLDALVFKEGIYDATYIE